MSTGRIELHQLHYEPAAGAGTGSDAFRLKVEDCRIESGTLAVLTGASGSGKTTLLNLIAGILLPDHGTVQVDDTVVSALSDAARRRFRIRSIGLVFQEFELVEYLNVLDNILLPCRISSAVELTRDVRRRAEELAETAGISPLLRRRVTQLSQGERQRVAICRALLLQPKLILADEPTGNLDPATSSRIVELLLDRSRAAQATLLMVTHDHSLLSRFDRVLNIEEIAAAGATA